MLAGQALASTSGAEASSETRTSVLGGPRSVRHARPRSRGGVGSSRAVRFSREKSVCCSVSLGWSVPGHCGAVESVGSASLCVPRRPHRLLCRTHPPRRDRVAGMAAGRWGSDVSSPVVCSPRSASRACCGRGTCSSRGFDCQALEMDACEQGVCLLVLPTFTCITCRTFT